MFYLTLKFKRVIDSIKKYWDKCSKHDWDKQFRGPRTAWEQENLAVRKQRANRALQHSGTNKEGYTLSTTIGSNRVR